MEHLPHYYCHRGVSYESATTGIELCRPCYLQADQPAYLELEFRIIHLWDTYPGARLNPCDRCGGELAPDVRPILRCYECLLDARSSLEIPWCEFELLVELLGLR